MKRCSLALLLLLPCLPLNVYGINKKTPDVDPRVRQVRTVYIKGDSDAADSARQNLSKLTCFRVAGSSNSADATLDFSKEQTASDSIFSADAVKSTVSAELIAKDGSVLWSSSGTQDSGLNTGAGSGASHVLKQLQAAAFPQVKTSSHGLDQSACTANTTAPPIATTEPAAPEPAAKATAAAARPPTFTTKEIKLGMDAEQVEKILGVPDTKVDLGEKILYVYKHVTVEFHNGKVTDAR